MNPSSPVGLVLYEDTCYQQANPLEATIISDLGNAVDAADSMGVITPHNAQRGLLQGGDPIGTTSPFDPADIDTVEPFQCDQRLVVFVSGTVIDTDYVSAEDDFILSQNRLNVALSRAKGKLIIVAAATIFEHVPTDIDTYQDTHLWKALYHDAGVLDTPPNGRQIFHTP